MAISQKRSASEQQDALDGVRILLLDIEGTTTPITFVKDKLFPYVRENLETYLENHWDNDECQADIKVLRDQAASDKDNDVEGTVDIPDKDANQEDIIKALVSSVNWQMDQDSKATALKTLQGHMWREAYKTGKVVGEIYDDVVPAIQQWLSQDRQVYIYSSGSVDAQKLLFGYSDKGDLLPLLSGYFDTQIGSKVEKASYSKIVEDVGAPASEILFLTDITKEAAAACEAGLKTCVVVREGNAKLTDEECSKYNTVCSFAELSGSDAKATPAKRIAEADDEDDDVEEVEDGDDGDEVDDDDDDDDVPPEDDDEGEVEEVSGQ